MMSLPPLGANGTTSVIGRAGNASPPCACAASVVVASASSASAVRRDSVFSSSAIRWRTREAPLKYFAFMHSPETNRLQQGQGASGAARSVPSPSRFCGPQ